MKTKANKFGNTFDLLSAIPYFSMPEDQRKEIWDDGTHLTEAGYDLMGTLLSERLLQLILETEVSEKGTQSHFKGELKTRKKVMKAKKVK
jgi:hypothetical protein